MGYLLKFLVYGTIFYYLFKFLAKLFGVFIIKKASQQFNNNQSQYTQQQQQQQQRKEGEINITKVPTDNKKHVKGGDYVDFEEVK